MKSKQVIMVIDHEVGECFIYDVDSDLLSEDIEDILSKTHHLSSCSWGEFNGKVNDLRD